MNIDESRQVGQAVRMRRKALGLTQRQVAEVAGVSDRFVVTLELGDSAGARLDKLMSVFGVLGITLEMHIPGEGNSSDMKENADSSTHADATADKDEPAGEAAVVETDAQSMSSSEPKAEAEPTVTDQDNQTTYKQAFEYALTRLGL